MINNIKIKKKINTNSITMPFENTMTTFSKKSNEPIKLINVNLNFFHFLNIN